MMITKPAVTGAVVALAGHGVAVGATMIAAVNAGGGPDADLDTGEKAGVLVIIATTYGIAQIVLLGACIASRWRLGPRSSPGLVLGWLLGLAVSVCYLCGGFST
ncbi:hypothetical protein AB0C12_33970 [Actinoplanes sp. NPDC048967]|uniref:hypothetical protein n=1 Tax=Actinoplanes sp. NPDC048967 TaxID=3155269 RepID=UPI00340C18CC